MDRDGFYGKYRVERADGKDRPGGKHHMCQVFVLDVTCDPFAVYALEAYAKACRDRWPRFADVLEAWAKKKRDGDPVLDGLRTKCSQAYAAMTEKERDVYQKRFGSPGEREVLLPACRICHRTIVMTSPDSGLCGPCYHQEEKP